MACCIFGTKSLIKPIYPVWFSWACSCTTTFSDKSSNDIWSHMHIYRYTHTCFLHEHVFTVTGIHAHLAYIWTHTHTHIYIYIYVCVYIYISMCAYVYISVYAYVYIYIYFLRYFDMDYSYIEAINALTPATRGCHLKLTISNSHQG